MSETQNRAFTNDISLQKCASWSRAISMFVATKLMRLGVGGMLVLGAIGSLEGAIAPGKNAVQAQQVTTDTTTNTQVTPFPGAFLVTGGTVEGRNLFHSFEDFSPETSYTRFDLQNAAYSNVENVFSRVTGGLSSNLNGVLEVLGGSTPNFFLLNPNGILIGPGANIAIPGTFFVSTADSLIFKDGTTFSASADTTSAPTLTVSVPTGLQFGAAAAPIAVNGRLTGPNQSGEYNGQEAYFLSENAGITLLGGNVDINDAFIYAPSGRIQVGSVAANSTVSIDPETQALSYAPDTTFQDIAVNDSALFAFAFGNSDGYLNMQSKQLTISGSNLAVDNLGRGSNSAVTLFASERVDIDNSRVTTTIFPGPPVQSLNPKLPFGAGGNITISTRDLFVRPTTKIGADTRTEAPAGNITINAETVSFLGQEARTPVTQEEPSIRVVSNAFEQGKGGTIAINAQTVLLSGGVVVGASTYSDYGNVETPEGDFLGAGGSVVFDVDSLTLKDGAQVGAASYGNAAAGSLIVRARDVSLSDRLEPSLTAAFLTTQLSSSTFGEGKGGLLSIEADSLDVSGAAGITSVSFELPSDPPESALQYGDGGDVSIDADTIRLSDGGAITTSTYTDGDAGNLAIKAGDLTLTGQLGEEGLPEYRPTSLSAGAFSGTGAGGRLTIESDRLRVAEGAQITASTFAAGDAGSIAIASNMIEVDGRTAGGFFSSAILSRSATGASAGSVTLTGDIINIRNGGTVSVSNLAGGSAGNVNLTANTVSLNNGSVRAEASAGSQGNLNITSQDLLLLRQGSTLTTDATETATGGNIFLDSPLIVGAENSDISANAIAGDGGNIRLITQGLVGLEFRNELTPQSDITATSELGVNGTVKVESPNADADSGLVQLPENLEDATNQVVAGCSTQPDNQFASTGRGGLPINPTGQLSSNRLWQDTRVLSTDVQTSRDIAGLDQTENIVDTDGVAVPEILEARQWQMNAAGKVELLTASAVTTQSDGCLQQKIASMQPRG